MKLAACLLILCLSICGFASQVAPEPVAAAEPASFGDCYPTYNCIGSPMGFYSDATCRSIGGHSIMDGIICSNL